jgi:hypothetical protein
MIPSRTCQELPAAPQSVRARLDRALAGEAIDWPVYAAYDWFVRNRPVDWARLVRDGLGVIAHADLVREDHPHLQIVERTEATAAGDRRVVRWITDRGELRESFLGEWRQEFPVKGPEDYRILQRAFEETRFAAVSEDVARAESEVGDRGIVLGHLGWTSLRRSPIQQIPIEYAGLERFSLDLADERPELMELIEQLDELTLQKCREAVRGPVRHIKLWENLSIETLGVRAFRRHLVPLYRRILDLFGPAGRRLVVHYDGRLRAIADDIAALDLDGLDSFTPPPAGDLSVAEARARWPEKFLWLHPPLGWYHDDAASLAERIRRMVLDAGARRCCLMISEDVPPRWEVTVPAVLRALEGFRR